MLGPVFRVELVNASRRKRSYAARTVHGLILLGIVGLFYREWQLDAGGGPVGPAMLVMTGDAVFRGFVIAQVLGVWLLTPAMVAATIAGDRQRMILDDLLASRLTGFEIVVGKLAARMLGLVMIIMVGLPILSLLSLFGGINPPFVLAAFGGTITTAFALASFSVYVSAVSRRGRDAVILVYLATITGFLVPRKFLPFLSRSTPIPGSWLKLVNTPFEVLDPFRLARIGTPFSDLLQDVGTMALSQLVVGLIFLGLAVWQLRRAFANGDRRSPIARLRARQHPPVGDDPILFKERYTSRMGWMARVFAVLGGVGLLAVFARDLSQPFESAVVELKRYGYGDAPIGVDHRARDFLQTQIAPAAAVVFGVWTLGLAATVAAGISSEREGDTWISLLATPLTGWDILRGKALGALWRWRWAGSLAVGLWTLGLVAGAIHPLGYALTLAAFVAFTALTIAVGLLTSSRMATSWKAIATTFATLFVLNLGPLLLRFNLCPAAVIFVAPARYSTVQILFGTYPGWSTPRPGELVSSAMNCTIVVLVSALSAVCLAAWTLNSFDRIASRPRRPPGYRRTEDDIP